jgi:hypothetical protein
LRLAKLSWRGSDGVILLSFANRRIKAALFNPKVLPRIGHRDHAPLDAGRHGEERGLFCRITSCEKCVCSE